MLNMIDVSDIPGYCQFYHCRWHILFQFHQHIEYDRGKRVECCYDDRRKVFNNQHNNRVICAGISRRKLKKIDKNMHMICIY